MDSSQAELAYIWILINGTRDQTRDIILLPENLWERVGERGSSLNSSEMVHSDVITDRQLAVADNNDRL